MTECSVIMKLHGFKFGQGRSIACASWIDHLFACSISIGGAVLILEHMERALLARWGLRFKPGSTGGLVCKMEPCQLDIALAEIDQTKWPISDVICVLGHWVQDDAGIGYDWSLAQRCMWAAVWANSGCRRASVMSTFQRVRLLYRTVTSAVTWRMSGWPFSENCGRRARQVFSA